MNFAKQSQISASGLLAGFMYFAKRTQFPPSDFCSVRAGVFSRLFGESSRSKSKIRDPLGIRDFLGPALYPVWASFVHSSRFSPLPALADLWANP